MGMEHLWKDIDRKTEVLWEKPISLSCKGSQIPCGLGWNWTQASLVGGGQLTTWKTKMQNEYIHCLVMYCLYQWYRYVTLFKDVFKICGLKLFFEIHWLWRLQAYELRVDTYMILYSVATQWVYKYDGYLKSFCFISSAISVCFMTVAVSGQVPYCLSCYCI
jgi:hypothetical protein